MGMLKVRRLRQTRRWKAVGLLVCVCVHVIVLTSCNQTDHVSKLISQLSDQDLTVQNSAIEALVKTGTPAVEPLIAALKDKYSVARVCAAEALGKIKDPRAVEPLIAALKDTDANVRQSATTALGRIQDPRAVEPLIASLRDPDASVRTSAAAALGYNHNPRAIEPLIAALNDQDHIVRQTAADALISQCEPFSEDLLIKLLNQANSKDLAEQFLNSPYKGLQQAARAWAAKYGYQLMTMPMPDWRSAH